MSAKRRQETLETFCVPIEHNAQETAIDPVPEMQQTRRSARSSRRGKGKGNAGEYQQEDVISINSGDDEDFMPQMDDDSDDAVDGAHTRGRKGKAKAKGKGKAASRSYPGSVDSDVNRSPNLNGVNPKIMLISLKAGALGLNLTVANNIYLWVHLRIVWDHADLRDG
jgi:SWI/SNF-related matrix-associated actin-dependent regulator of chromatin subfamily A3